MNKKLVYIASFVFILSACGDTKKEEDAAKTPVTETKPVPPPEPTLKNGLTQLDYDKGLALVGASDCFTCHKVAEKYIGPAYKDVANRYTAHPDTLDKLATKIIKGGVGTWGQIPMPAHPQLAKEDAIQMVKYVLTIE